MFAHNKRLQYTVRVSQTDPVLANLLLEQFGGPQGELAAAMRYFTQAISEDDPGRKDMLYDIATEELSHLEVIGTIVCMLNKGMKGAVAEGLNEQGELYRRMNQGGDSHVTSLLYGAGAPLTNSAGVPWTAGYIDTIGDPTCDLRSNIAAESRAKMIYERLINTTDDPGVADALGFPMTREIAHQKSFEKALYAIEPNFLCVALLCAPASSGRGPLQPANHQTAAAATIHPLVLRMIPSAPKAHRLQHDTDAVARSVRQGVRDYLLLTYFSRRICGTGKPCALSASKHASTMFGLPHR